MQGFGIGSWEPDASELADVTITVAPHDRYARVVRTVVASCASLDGFDVDDLADVRLLVDTAFHALTDIAISTVDISVVSVDGGLTIEMSARQRPNQTVPPEDMQPLEAIAAVVADERWIESVDGHFIVRTRLHPRHPD